MILCLKNLRPTCQLWFFFTEFLKLFSNTLPEKLIIVLQKFYITGPLYKECPLSPDLGLGIIIWLTAREDLLESFFENNFSGKKDKEWK